VHPPRRGEHVLDVETLALSADLPNGWGDMHAMRVSCCVLHDVATARDYVFAAEPVPGAIPGTRPLEGLYWFLEGCRSEGCTLVGHNIRSFDWEVLAGEFAARGLLADRRAYHAGSARLVDTLGMLHARLGWRPSLQTLAVHNLGEGKSMDGALAPSLWRQGLRREVIAYCRRDVELTRRVWQKGRAEGRVAVERLPDGSLGYVQVEW
jgi:DEAD/DEAH box helicase domain-containing protein